MKKAMAKRGIPFFVCVALLMTQAGVSAHGLGITKMEQAVLQELTFDISEEGWIVIEEGTDAGTFKIKCGDNVLTDNVNPEEPITITGTSTGNQLEVNTGTSEVPVKLIFERLGISRARDLDSCLVRGVADITLRGENRLSAGHPAINLNSLEAVPAAVTIGGEGRLNLGTNYDGIGGAAGTSVTINGGIVTANGLDTGDYGESITTTITGNPFVVSTGGINQDHKDDSSGVIFERNTGAVYGSPVTPETDGELPPSGTLMIEAGKQLTLPAGVTLVNHGEIHVS